jgi:tRNA threonylcarbamoyladenosine biosynthesis protein TsaB
MSAKVFAYATGCAFLAIDTFAAIAEQCPPEANRVDVLADAQQGNVYTQRYARLSAADAWQAETDLAIRPFADWEARREPDVWTTGPGLVLHQVSSGLVVRQADWESRPESLLKVGLARYLRDERDDPWQAEPLYLRPSSAEEKWDLRRKP